MEMKYKAHAGEELGTLERQRLRRQAGGDSDDGVFLTLEQQQARAGVEADDDDGVFLTLEQQRRVLAGKDLGQDEDDGVFLTLEQQRAWEHKDAAAQRADVGVPAAPRRKALSLDDVAKALAGGGEPLPPELRERAEMALGVRLDRVRVHRGEAAERLCAAFGVRAFAFGDDIVLGPDVGSDVDEVLVHEIVHTVQQRGGVREPGKAEVASAGGAVEREAGQGAGAIFAGRRVQVATGVAVKIWGFESYEHRSLGDLGAGGERVLRLRKDPKVVLTWGEVVALAGDFYSTPQNLLEAEPEEVKALLRVMDRQRQQAEANAGRPMAAQAAENDKEFERITSWRRREQYDEDGRLLGLQGKSKGTDGKTYLELALDNALHFSQNNVGHWEELHKEARRRALNSYEETCGGIHDSVKRNDAYLTDAFACHYLTDAFAAGHLVSGKLGREVGQQFWNKHMYRIIEALSRALSAEKKIPEESALSLMAGVVGYIQSDCDSLCVKLVHDHLNRNGVEVMNRRGDTWRTLGDNGLADSPETQRLAVEAVRLSHDEIEGVARYGKAHEAKWKPSDLAPSDIAFLGEVIPLEEFAKTPSSSRICSRCACSIPHRTTRSTCSLKTTWALPGSK